MNVVDAPTPSLGVDVGMLQAVVIDGPTGTRLAEGLPGDHPHRHAVDLLDMWHLVLVTLGSALREEVVSLRHVRVGIHHPQAFSQLEQFDPPLDPWAPGPQFRPALTRSLTATPTPSPSAVPLSREG